MRQGGLILALAVLTVSACATGDSLVTGAARPPIAPESVRLYTEPPAQYEVIGLVTASSHLGVNSQANLDRAIADIRERAAEMGANGVILDYSGRPSGNSPLVGTAQGGVFTAIPTSDSGDREVRGRAVFVP